MKKAFYVVNLSVFVLLFLTVILSVAFATKSALAANGCIVLTKDLSYGSTNSNSGSQVTMLQTFLHSKGYLNASPTGRYGDQTVAAVKKFQSANGIKVTGTVGPITRSAIGYSKCINASSALIPLATPPIAPVAPVIAPVPVENNLIYAPSADAQLTTGQKYQISWNGTNNQNSIFVLLENADGSAAGYVSGNLLGTTNSFIWTVGNVSLAGQKDVILAPGRYRLKIVDSSFSNSFSIRSGIFKINEAPLYITHILPTAIPADGKSTGVIYGSGFNSLTRIKLDGPYIYASIIRPQSISSEGNFAWFNVPQYFTPGQYQVSLYNDYSTSEINSSSTPSNSATIQIVAETQ